MKSLLLALALAPLLPCIWDTDTLEDELLGLPEARDLVVTGRWVRHGRAYYEKRVREIPARIENEPADLDLYDDLAVAQDRLGDPAAALAVMERKAKALEASPDEGHRYRLLANRGTFLAHAGKFDEGAADLERAVAMNPESHFGREKFQIALVRYLGAAAKDPEVWRTENFLTYGGYDSRSIIKFSRKPWPPGTDLQRNGPLGGADGEAALTAIAGMLRFEGPGAAELVRSIGDLQARRWNLHLAWWAWHRALDLGHPAREEIRRAIGGVEHHWAEAGLLSPPSEEDFLPMKENGEAWLAAYQAAEAECFGRGEDPGSPESLARLRREADARTPGAPSVGHFRLSALFVRGNWVPYAALGVLLLLGFLTVRVVRDHRRKWESPRLRQGRQGEAGGRKGPE